MRGVKIIQGMITKLLILIIIVLVMVFFLPQCLGYQPYNMQTGSMAPEYPVGSMIYVKSTRFENLKVGDVITYRTGEGMGWVVTHRIEEIDVNTQLLTMKGDASNMEEIVVPYACVIGRTTDFSVPFLGSLVTQYQTKYGKVITIGIILLLLAISFTLDWFYGEPDYEEEELE